MSPQSPALVPGPSDISGPLSIELSLPPRAASHPPAGAALDDPALYLNRELSWLEFNQRVLDEAIDASPPSAAGGAAPLLERLRFLCISVSNLDEFFMVRVAGLKQQLASGVTDSGADGLPPAEVLARLVERTQRMVADQYRLFRQELLPRLRGPQPAGAGVSLLAISELTADQRRYLHAYFQSRVYPALTPLAVDPGHPFPHLRNKSLNLAIMLLREPRGGAKAAGRDQEVCFAVVQVPAVLGRLVDVPTANPQGRACVYMEDIIALHVADLFPGTQILGCWPFRVTRNFDRTIDEEESMDLLQTIQKEVRRRDRGNAVRLECVATMDPTVRRFLARALKLAPQDVYLIDPGPAGDGPLNLADLMILCAPSAGRGPEPRELSGEPFVPQVVPRLAEASTVFEAIAGGDILLHQPYESFESVVDFIEEAAEDPSVLAIKGTLYRTSGNSAIVAALARAAECGKQVTALVELKARFDEENNIAWARQLEDAGVHVVYGLIGLKTHGKVAMVVRREGGGIRRYVHLSTGNSNPHTARQYTDLSFFTCREEFGIDASALFNLLTGYSQPPRWNRLLVAPLGLKERVIQLIDAEARSARAGQPARIIAKMNALADPDVIRALYQASQAGVPIDLIVRGICCLRPEVPGVSENIRVLSIVDRFLEHSRIFSFHAAGRGEVYVSSADWMPRNFLGRVELMFPIEDPALKARLQDEILGTLLADNTKARRLRRDGSYERLAPGAADAPVRAQQRFMDLARAQAAAPRALHLVEKGLRICPSLLLRAPSLVPERRGCPDAGAPQPPLSPPPPPAADVPYLALATPELLGDIGDPGAPSWR